MRFFEIKLQVILCLWVVLFLLGESAAKSPERLAIDFVAAVHNGDPELIASNLALSSKEQLRTHLLAETRSLPPEKVKESLARFSVKTIEEFQKLPADQIVKQTLTWIFPKRERIQEPNFAKAIVVKESRSSGPNRRLLLLQIPDEDRTYSADILVDVSASNEGVILREQDFSWSWAIE